MMLSETKPWLRCAVVWGLCGNSACLLGAQETVRNVAVSSAQAVIRRAEQMQHAHDLNGAVAGLEDFLAAHGKQYEVLVELAKLRATQKDNEHEREALIEALSLQPESVEVNLALGRLLLRLGDGPEAMDRFETVLSTHPHDAAARDGELQAATELATSMRKQGKPELALLALKHARAVLPDDAQLLLETGIQQTELGQLPDALLTLEAARRLRPKDPAILYALAHAQFDAQHVADAEHSLAAYLQMKPNDASAHFALGRAYEVEQRTELARAEFEHSIALQPLQTESYYELGDMDLNAGDPTAAEPLLRRVLGRDPQHGGALTDMGRICLARKENASAEEWLAKAVTAAPEYAQAHYQHGVALSRLNRKDDAERELAAATELTRVPAPAAPQPK